MNKSCSRCPLFGCSDVSSPGPRPTVVFFVNMSFYPRCSPNVGQSRRRKLAATSKKTVFMALPSRRQFTTIALCSLLAVSTSPRPTRSNGSSPRRTVFDEERERNEEMLRAIQQRKTAELRAAFDAVEKAQAQLDDVQKFLDDGDWDGLKRFTRLFNDAVEREGMEKTAGKLQDRKTRKEAIALSKSVTNKLREVDRYANNRDGDAVAAGIKDVRNLVSDFQKFRP